MPDGAIATTMTSPADRRAGEILRLRREIGRMQRRHSDDAVIPVDAALQDLLPDRGLHTGAVYSVSPSPSLIFALMSASSRRGGWCAAVGMPTLGLEAAAAFGIDLSRLILVPDPGDRWLVVVSALAEVVPLIAMSPGSAVRDQEAARLAARLRDRGCTLLSTAQWPQSEGMISLHDPQWEGIGEGWGLLSDRTVTVTAQTRTSPRPQSLQVRLPGSLGGIEPAPITPVAPVLPVAPVRRIDREQTPLPTHPSWAVA
ncbi:hypothetical protein [Microbacterium esteraromaticum]|uniref:hypothetical protein n=1 Tax=Microbacterium esteraromaticum TaxID=57043 RepID=UPI001C9830B4|nr:hypothetical protein [Microbacterium esteraromaticum]MBY6062352.1 hypothetical protein [Microbacterium esteraromaticum]